MKTSEILTKALEAFGPEGENWIGGGSCPTSTGECTTTALMDFCHDPARRRTIVNSFLGFGTDFADANAAAWHWNDDPSRTFADVRQRYQTAIVKAKESGD
jgi:hypothetical protein